MRKIVIDIKKAELSAHKRYRGAGMISANNSSRLLLDYKYEHPELYEKLLEHIFGKNGIGAAHFKLEMGSDINSTSGTEPCVKRTAAESANVRRGTGYHLAADIKKRYPHVTLDMLFWSEPKWVTDSDDVMDARYRWYKESLTAAYRTYGLKFDYISVNRNERGVDAEWIKYIARRIKADKDCPYDFSKIKIVAADEDNSWRIAESMANDEELRNAVDIIGTHYTSRSTDNARLMCEKYGKELWFSEGSAPMTYARGAARFDGSGLSGLNGVLDIANRIVAMYPCGLMTLYEYQPAIASYYDGVTFCHKQLITACEPWSGHYTLDCGYYMSLHFSQFFRKGWCFIPSACYNDSKIGGDGHALVDTKYSYMTACEPETGDHSTVIVNSSETPLEYAFSLNSGRPLNIWETRGPDSGEYNENYFRKTGTLAPEKTGGKYTLTLTVKPFSMVTVSTLDGTEPERTSGTKTKLLELPYSDDFGYSRSYVLSRGGTPRFTSDQGGAFEVKSVSGNSVLMQKITPRTKAMEWGGTPLPMTSLGDDRWCDYTASARVRLHKSRKPSENFIGVGSRCFLTCSGVSGYSLLVYEDKRWALRRNGAEVLSGAAVFDPYSFTGIAVRAVGGAVSAYIGGSLVGEYKDNAVLCAGRAALFSSYNKNCFDRIDITPVSEAYFITRYDDTDEVFRYSGDWKHNTMNSFANYKRTLSSGGEGAQAALSFEGSRFAVFGENGSDTVVDVDIDGKTQRVTLPHTGCREIFLSRRLKKRGKHRVTLTVVSGTLNIDGAEIG